MLLILEILGLSPSSKVVFYIKIFGKKDSTIKPRSASAGKMCGKGRLTRKPSSNMEFYSQNRCFDHSTAS